MNESVVGIEEDDRRPGTEDRANTISDRSLASVFGPFFKAG